MTKRVYLAGPMSGIPQYNYPAFDYMAKLLRNQVGEPGETVFEVVSPAEIDDPAVRAAALGSHDGHTLPGLEGVTWGDFLSRDVKVIADGKFDAIVVLPGWETSRGARLETFVGHLAGCKIVRPEIGWNGYHVSLWEVPRGMLIRAWEGIEDGE